MAAFRWKKWFKDRATTYLTHIYEGKSIIYEGGNPKVSLSGFSYRDHLEVLSNAIDCSDRYSHRKISEAVFSTLFQPENYTTDEFLVKVKFICDNEQTVVEEYVFFTGINMPGGFPARSIKSPVGTFRIIPRTDPVSVARLVEIQERLCEKLSIKPNSCNYLVRFNIDAHDATEAFDHAADELLLVRSALNYCINQYKHSKLSFGNDEQTPVNDVLTGTIASVHTKRFAPAYDGVWIEELGKRTTAAQNIDWGKVYPRFQKTMRALRQNHGLISDAKIALQIYGRALDNSDYRQAFIGLWVTLEHLLLHKNEAHDAISRRASKLWRETELIRVEFEHFREIRNRFVHSRFEGTQMLNQTAIYHLNRLVCLILAKFIFNPLQFQSKSELIKFLNLESSEHALANAEANIKRAKKFYAEPKS